MAKKAFPKARDLSEADFTPDDFPAGESKPRFSWLVNRSFDLLKLVFGLCFLPFVYGITISFLQELTFIDAEAQRWFWSGVIGFVLFHFFVWEPGFIFSKGQQVMEFLFAFVKPMVKIAPYVFPVFAVVVTLAYGMMQFFTQEYLELFMILFGATLSMHLVFGAKSIRGKKGDLLKSNYIFSFSFVYIFTLLLAGFVFNLYFTPYSFVRFVNNAYQSAYLIFAAIFGQLFVTG